MYGASDGPWNFLNGRREVISVNQWDGGQSLRHPPLRAGLWTPRDLSLDAIWFTWFVYEITEGEARKEIWSSVNHQFFVSALIYGKSQQIRQGIAWSKDLKGVLGLEVSRAWGAWFKVSDKTKGPPAENSFLPKAVYKPPLVRTSFHFSGITCEGPFSVTSCWHKMLY